MREAVADVVRKQVEAGIDIVTDGEQGKSSFFSYIVERFNGFERKPAAPGKEADRARRAGSTSLSPSTMHGPSVSPNRLAVEAEGAGHSVDTCTGPVSYRGHEAVQADIANLKAAIEGPDPRRRLHSRDRFLLRRGYFCQRILPDPRGIRAGDIQRDARRVQGDRRRRVYSPDRRSAPGHLLHDEPGAQRRRLQEVGGQRVEAINDSIRGIPPEKIRFHTCYSIDVGPRIHEMDLKDIVDIMLKINADAYSFEAANPRHEHEYHVFERVKLPAGKILIPGVISHTTNLVEHPELVAERIVRFAKLVGRENVIAGADCGFAASALRFNDTHPSVAWLKFAALAEGARLATRELWN